MKKVLAILLAILMTLGLFACGKTAGSGPTASASPSASTSTPSAKPSAEPSVEPSGEEPAATPGDISDGENDLGYFSSGVDPFSREKYKIVWLYPRTMALMQNITDVLTAWGEKLNYELIASTGDGDIDMYIQQMELYANQGVDGFLLNFDVNSRFRIKEVADDIGIPYMSVLNSVRSEEGSCIIPCVTLDGYQLGLVMMDWMYENQETYWGATPDASEVGYIGITWSQNKDLDDRYVASAARFLELYPGNDANVFVGDGVVGKMDAQTGSDLTAPIISGNPNIKYWYIVGVLEQYAQGAALAAEDLGVGKNAMATTVNSDVLTGMWDTGYDGCFVSCVAVSPAMYAAPSISALLAIIEGKATFETLWTSRRAPGDECTVYNMDTQVVTKETYKAYFEGIQTIIDNTQW